MQNKIIIKYLKTAVGELILGSYGDKLCLCDWRYRKRRDAVDGRIQKELKAAYVEGETGIIQKAEKQLQEYLAGERKHFDVPLLLAGTNFQKQVWLQLQQLPFGKTKSYLQLARELNNEKAVRALASANGANAISIIIPCHRIIGSNGKLVGYAGGLDTKRKLLELEGSGEQLTLF